MSWVLVEDWLSVGGLLVLAAGTGAQAWATKAEYQQVISTLSEDSKAAIEKVKPVVETLGQIFESASLSLTFRIARWTVMAAITVLLAPRKMAEIRNAGGSEAVQLAQLVRLSAVWTVLMLGAILVLAAAIIQLVTAYF
jgi:hypothetical protein